LNFSFRTQLSRLPDSGALPVLLLLRNSCKLTNARITGDNGSNGGLIMESAKVGKRGAIIVPAKLRKRFGIEEGSLVTAEEREDGILIRPAVVVPVERYTPERKAEFILSNATTEADYRQARKEVQKLGLDPDSIPHRRPA
jgi:AbrB family looped-hinge helix DNA binding protein